MQFFPFCAMYTLHLSSNALSDCKWVFIYGIGFPHILASCNVSSGFLLCMSHRQNKYNSQLVYIPAIHVCYLILYLTVIYFTHSMLYIPLCAHVSCLMFNVGYVSLSLYMYTDVFRSAVCMSS